MNTDSLGDRMKRYEAVTQLQLNPRSCVIVRVDGRAFHSLTKTLNRPFDKTFMTAMDLSAMKTADEMQGCKVAYVQSDEVSFLLTDFDNLDTQGWFGYNLQKMVSISASAMTKYFNSLLSTNPSEQYRYISGMFDSRAFVLPDDEVSNYFLWRIQDCERNSVQQYAQSFFSHKELMNKTIPNIHEMLHRIGKNWTNDLTSREKNGTIIVKPFKSVLGDGFNGRPVYEEVNRIIEPLIVRGRQ